MSLLIALRQRRGEMIGMDFPSGAVRGAQRVGPMGLALHFEIAPAADARPDVRRAGRRTMRYRSGLNAARSSDAKSAGSSHAAKCPPRSTSLKYARRG